MKQPVPSRYGRGRATQKMVLVDFSNPFTRDYYPKWLAAHGEYLRGLRANLAAWAADARAAEAATGNPPRPIAVVFDIDEVLLCNTHLNGFQAPAGAQGPQPVDFHAADFFVDRETGKPWGREDPGDPPLPGAAALLEAVGELGIQPFFVTGRLESIRGITVEDFRRAGFLRGPDTPRAALAADDLAAGRDILVMVPDGQYPPPGSSVRPFKEARRAEIEKTHRIMLNVGDQLSDLGLHGDRQFYLPHPFYSTY